MLRLLVHHIETQKPLVKDEEASDVDVHLYRSIGELTFFLGLQVKQKPDGIFISQD
ncbi:hypothetical protein Tco_0314798, partial [Tanacetum coccineum]